MSTGTLRIRLLSFKDAANQPFKNILLYVKKLTQSSAPGEATQILEEIDPERAIVLSFNETFDLLEEEEYFQVLFVKAKAELKVIADLIFWRNNLLDLINNRKAGEDAQSEVVRHATLEQNYVVKFSLQLIGNFAERNADLFSTLTNQSNIRGHSMWIRQFNYPVHCAICRTFIWGVHRQGFECSQCLLVTHRKCRHSIPFWCEKAMKPGPKILLNNRQVQIHSPHAFGVYSSSLIESFTSRRRSHCSHCGSQVGRKALKCARCSFIIHEHCERNIPALCTMTYSSLAAVFENELFTYIEAEEKPSIENVSDSSSTDFTELEPLVDNGLIPPPQCSDFVCVGRLGNGRYGVVYCVQHTASKEYLAIKVIDGRIDEARHQFEVEKHILYRYSDGNPYMIKPYCNFHQGKHLFLVMEYVDGDTLCQKIGKARMDEDDCRFYLAEILSIIQYLHSNKIVYRDLKLEHVIIRPDGHIRLIDYGLGRILKSSDELCHTICGTHSYMAPEIRGRESGSAGNGYSYSVDYWALGMILAQMLCGERFDLHPDNDSPLNFLSNLQLPNHISAEARSCLTGLLESTPENRLGSLNSSHGSIREHPFFRMGHKINWEEIDDGLFKTVQRKPIIVPIGSDPWDIHFTLSSSSLDRTAGAKATWMHIAESSATSEDEERFKAYDYVNQATWVDLIYRHGSVITSVNDS